MAAPRLVPSDSILAKWVDEGLNAQQMVDRILERDNKIVSKSSIHAALSRAGLTKRVRYDTHVPWSPIRADHSRAYPLVMLRLLARRDGGQELTQEQSERLESWMQRLADEDAVVSYVYDSEEGFQYFRRQPTDQEYPPVRVS